MRDRPNDQHRHVAESALGRRLRPNEVVHHLDEDKSNNAKSNLQVEARDKHSKDHGSKNALRLRRLRAALRMTKERKKLY